MFIPPPRFEPVDIDLTGLSFWGRLKTICLSPPRFRYSEDWIVTLDNGLRLIIPKGFVTDFASVPRIFWAIPGFSPNGPLLWGAGWHDFAFQHGYLLSPFDPGREYDLESHAFYATFNITFGDNIPVFVGAKQEVFDNLLAEITIKKTGAEFIAAVAKEALGRFGDKVWNKYRKLGPGAYNENSLGLPGLTASGVAF